MSGFPLTVPDGYRVGAWTVERPLGAGAFASVYAARRSGGRDDLPALTALKFLPTGTRTPRQLCHLRELVEREVELLRRLRSPRLIRMYETLTVDDPAHPELDGATVLVLEKAEGSLQALLSGAAPPPAGPALLVQVCEGLHQLHTAGWVHGDLKPANVLLMEDGSVRLGDFSTASELEGTHAYAPGFATPDHTPPELLWAELGDRGMRIRPSADIWAFGVLAHLVLTGASPLPGGTPTARRDAALRYARGEEELRLSPGLPPPWREIVADCLSRTHEERAAHDAASLLRRVREASAGRVTRRRIRLPRARRRAVVAAAGLAATALGFALSALGREADAGTDASGYERCVPGAVCFFSEPGGRGEMCSWQGNSPDWSKGPGRCAWAAEMPARSVFNNGNVDRGTNLIDVEYYSKAAHKELMGCLKRTTRTDFTTPVSPMSHMWRASCTSPSEVPVREPELDW
ncbi:protein kinase [Streptomyces sp. NPDC059875]|uniref:protein kinase domain-containing protein n=1 Tax=unclassified Streptomyces TaxID=2593676 RepID=UPI00364FEB32